MPFPIAAFIGLCKICATVGGFMFCTHQIAKAYNKNQKNKKEKLALKGKTIEQATKDNEVAQKENDEWKKKYEQQERENKRIEEELDKANKKANDPSLPEEERAKWRRKVADLEDELKKGKNKSKTILDTIKSLGERIKKNNKTISDSASNLDDNHWIWEFLTLENIMIMGGCYVLYQLLKEEKKR